MIPKCLQSRGGVFFFKLGLPYKLIGIPQRVDSCGLIIYPNILCPDEPRNIYISLVKMANFWLRSMAAAIDNRGSVASLTSKQTLDRLNRILLLSKNQLCVCVLFAFEGRSRLNQRNIYHWLAEGLVSINWSRAQGQQQFFLQWAGELEARRLLFWGGYLSTSVMAEEAEEKHLQQETMSVVNPESLSPTKPLANQVVEPEVVVVSNAICTEDPMLGFLTLLAKVERPACANCESKDLSPMFFCNTCGRFPLSSNYWSFKLYIMSIKARQYAPYANKTLTAQKCFHVMMLPVFHRTPRNRSAKYVGSLLSNVYFS